MDSGEQLADALRETLREQTREIFPPTDLADRVIKQRRQGRARVRAATSISLVVAVAAAVTLVLSAIGSGSTLAHPLRLRLAGYAFSLPAGARVVPARPAGCLIGYLTIAQTQAVIGTVPRTRQPAIANAITRDGGCVSLMLTTAHSRSRPDALMKSLPALQQRAVRIGAYRAEIGTSRTVGERVNLNKNGVSVPHKTEFENIELDVQLPAGAGRVRDLLVAAAGVSEQQLITIVASGLHT
jgi:hypothetical protein